MRPKFLRGFWKLTWVETKIFTREPMGFVGTLLMPLVVFVALGRALGAGKPVGAPSVDMPFNPAILAAVLIAISAVQSLVAIISIYREGGILKRLRATPLSPVTIMGAQVAVKLVFTVISLTLLMLAGRRLFPGVMHVNVFSFTLAVLLGTFSILSLGFVLASIVPTARFAQPIGAAVLYPMLFLSGLFFPVDRLPRALAMLAYLLPTTHAVSLLQGVWDGSGWGAHWLNAVALLALFGAFTALSTRVFRWE
ncbi:MAG: type transport system permease protein [Gemmatimonadaceae bacterium]|jgi:ABC-2 type transport system permease protein|nr:type transport system permease protein [Gemmatimonadaceae bacterium]